MDEKIITFQNVSKVFRLPHQKKHTLKEHALHLFHRKDIEPFYSLRDINFSVRRGECLGIIGKNGSGKSTLLRLIGGIYPPTTGNITVKGTIAPFIEIGVGFQGDMSGKDNVYLYGSIMGLHRNEIKKKYHDIVQFAGIENFMDQKLRHYSSGMQVRLAFSILVHVNVDILLIDEALAVGDEDFQKKCLTKIEEFKKMKKTIIFISHNSDQIARVCDSCLWLEQGIIKATSQDTIALNLYAKNNSL